MEANGTYDIYHDLVIESSLTEVFNSVSEPNQLIKWWPMKCSGTVELGQEYNFYFGEEYNWYGKVIKLLPNKSFHVKMTKSDTDWEATTFGFDLESIDDKVQVKFWHKGWPECNAHYRRSSFCWALLLDGLKNYVENGEIIPFEKRN